jgi:hypothetical protein
LRIVLLDPRDFRRDPLRRQNKIDTPAGDRAFGHRRLLRRFKLLGDRDVLNFADGAEAVGAVSVVAGHDDGDAFSVPVLGEGAKKDGYDVLPTPGL